MASCPRTLYLCICCLVLRVVETGNAYHARNLRYQLFYVEDYDKTVRPEIEDYQNPTEIIVRFALLSINGLEEASETLETTGFLILGWIDPFLSWDPNEYGNLSYTFFPQNDIWKPDIALKNSVKEYKELGTPSLNVHVDSEGAVSWYPFQNFKSTCEVDITNFPFDVQNCELEFTAWSYTTAEVSLTDDIIELGQYEPSPEWELVNASSRLSLDNDDTAVVYTLTLKRKPRHIIINIVLPSLMLSALAVFAFVLPCDSGEKASYTVTVFLAFAVFLTLVSESLPENSDTVSWFSVYLVIQIVQSTLITLISIAQIRLSHLDSKTHIPKPLVLLVSCLYCKCCSRNRRKGSGQRSSVLQRRSQRSDNEMFSSGLNENIYEPHGEPVILANNPGRRKVYKYMRDERFSRPQRKPVYTTTNNHNDSDYVKSVNESPFSTEDIYDWRTVVNALDLLFFCFFVLVTTISTVICLYSAYAAASV